MLIAVANEKGGVGKTTLAVNLAVLRAGSGHVVKLIDTDEQESAYEWGTARIKGNVLPEIRRAKLTGDILSDLLAERDAVDTVFVDAGGNDSAELRSAVAACDVLVMPVRPGQFDLWALGRMAKLVAKARDSGAKCRALAVLNCLDPRSIEARDMRAMLADMSDFFETWSGTLRERVAIRNAVREGKGVAELARGLADDKAFDELSQLYLEVFRDETSPA